MCCCGKPTINGTPNAYSWDGKQFFTSPVNAPTLRDKDTLLYDEPGRCGGLDCHSHHFTLVADNPYRYLLVRHGGGEERIQLGTVSRLLPDLESLGTNGRFWLFHTLYSTHRDATDMARDQSNASWRKAAAEKRIKTRKVSTGVKVWIEPEAP